MRTAAVIGLIAGAYSIAKSLAPWDKAVAAILIGVVVAGGIYWLIDLQGHLYRTRLRIDPYDPDPRWRGTDVCQWNGRRYDYKCYCCLLFIVASRGLCLVA